MPRKPRKILPFKCAAGNKNPEEAVFTDAIRELKRLQKRGELQAAVCLYLTCDEASPRMIDMGDPVLVLGMLQRAVYVTNQLIDEDFEGD